LQTPPEQCLNYQWKKFFVHVSVSQKRANPYISFATASAADGLGVLAAG
jgi:hypothetical protein